MCRSSIILGLSDSGLFHGLLLTILRSQIDFHGCRTPRCEYMLVVKTRRLGRFWPVSWTITQFWGPKVISMIDEPRGAFTCRSSTLPIFVDSELFRGLLLTVLGVRKRFPWLSKPKVCLRVGRQDSQFGPFWPISLTITQFWVPNVISTIDEPRGAFTCRSSTLRFLSILTYFMEYYSPFWGSQSNFHGCRTPRCAYVLVIKTHSLGRFWPFL